MKVYVLKKRNTTIAYRAHDPSVIVRKISFLMEHGIDLTDYAVLTIDDHYVPKTVSAMDFLRDAGGPAGTSGPGV